MVAGTESKAAVEQERSAGDAEARAHCSRASACGAKPAFTLMTFTPGAGAPPGGPAGLLVVETGKPTQVVPVGAGGIASISCRQQLASGAGHRRFQQRGAETNPGLQMSGTGLQDDTGVMP